LPFSKKLSNIVYDGNGKIFCYITVHRNVNYPQIMLYNLDKVYPEFDRYSFTKEKERLFKAKLGSKFSKSSLACTQQPQHSPVHPTRKCYTSCTDLSKQTTIDEVDKPKKNQAKKAAERQVGHVCYV